VHSCWWSSTPCGAVTRANLSIDTDMDLGFRGKKYASGFVGWSDKQDGQTIY
jgi:hypothetical protein